MPTVQRLSKLAQAMVGAMLLGLLATSAATAASTVGITVGADPVESITTQLGVAGTALASSAAVSLTVKPSGGEGCAANFQGDQGSSLIGSYGDVSSGPYNKAVNWTFQSAGSYLLCAWITEEPEPNTPPVATAALTINVRPPHIALSISAPARVAPGQTFQVATVGQSETSRNIDELIVPNTGRGCPANAEAGESAAGRASIHGIYDPWVLDGGPFTDTQNMTIPTLGAYLVCAYAEYPDGANVPEASATAAIAVVAPPAPCVVPALRAGTSLRTTEHRILAAHCIVGKLSHTYSSRYRSGTLIRLSPRSGTRLAPQAAVGVVVSKGRRSRHHRR